MGSAEMRTVVRVRRPDRWRGRWEVSVISLLVLAIVGDTTDHREFHLSGPEWFSSYSSGVRVEEALSILGVNHNMMTQEQVRAAYVAQLRRYHPDVSRHPDAGQRTAQIVAAYRFLKQSGRLRPRPPAPPARMTHRDSVGSNGSAPPPHHPDAPVDGMVLTHADPAADPTGRMPTWSVRSTEAGDFGISVIADDTISIGLPTDAASRFLDDSAHNVGEIIYLDRSAGLMQLLVRFVDQPICQIILDIQGRAATGTTELFCSIASIDDRPAPPIDDVTRFVAQRLAMTAEADDREPTWQ